MKRWSDARHVTRNKRIKANVHMCRRNDLVCSWHFFSARTNPDESLQETFREEIPVFPSDTSTNDQISLLSFSNEQEETKRALVRSCFFVSKNKTFSSRIRRSMLCYRSNIYLGRTQSLFIRIWSMYRKRMMLVGFRRGNVEHWRPIGKRC